MHDTASPASRQGDDQQTHSEYTEFQVVNFVGEPLGPRHDTEDDAYIWASSEYGRLPAGFSVEPVPGQDDADAEGQSSKSELELSGHAGIVVVATGTAAVLTGGPLVEFAVLGSGLGSLVAAAVWQTRRENRSDDSEGEA